MYIYERCSLIEVEQTNEQRRAQTCLPSAVVHRPLSTRYPPSVRLPSAVLLVGPLLFVFLSCV